MEGTYYYQNRVVAFLDVLGFREKLNEFESEVSQHIQEEREGPVQSQTANDFIETFLNAINRVDPSKFKYYLFSDNICLTLNYDSDKNLLLELLMLITDLYYAFAKKGYFLRGGIDYGKFISQDRIALGRPLVTAYKLETTVAVYPRIMVSENFKKIFEEYSNEQQHNAKLPPFINALLKNSCENHYLNIFLKIFQTDNKLDFLTEVQTSITRNLEQNCNKEYIFVKYDWLAKEFNCFIDEYTENLAYLDSSFEPDDEFLEQVKSLKI